MWNTNSLLPSAKHATIGFQTTALEGKVAENQCKIVVHFYPLMKRFLMQMRESYV